MFHLTDIFEIIFRMHILGVIVTLDPIFHWWIVHHDMAVASQRDYSCSCGTEGDIWDDTLKQMQKLHYVSPWQLCSHISSVSVTTAARFWGRWPGARPWLRCNPLSGCRRGRRTLKHSHWRAICRRHIMRVINVSGERCVIGRWLGELSGRSAEHRRRASRLSHITMCQSSHLTWPSRHSGTPAEIVWIFFCMNVKV